MAPNLVVKSGSERINWQADVFHSVPPFSASAGPLCSLFRHPAVAIFAPPPQRLFAQHGSNERPGDLARSVIHLTLMQAVDGPVLCVDLDGTLVATDLLWESLVSALQRSPWIALALPFWLLRGRAYVKRRVADESTVDFATLPYREDVVAFVRGEFQRGRPSYWRRPPTNSSQRAYQAIWGCLRP